LVPIFLQAVKSLLSFTMMVKDMSEYILPRHKNILHLVLMKLLVTSTIFSEILFKSIMTTKTCPPWIKIRSLEEIDSCYL